MVFGWRKHERIFDLVAQDNDVTTDVTIGRGSNRPIGNCPLSETGLLTDCTSKKRTHDHMNVCVIT